MCLDCVTQRTAMRPTLRYSVSPVGIAGSVVPAFWTRDAEAPASSDASASCYDLSEHIRILPVVVAKLKLREVQREILLADMMESANYPTLEQSPERFDIVRMNHATYIFASPVTDRFMR